MSNFIISAYHTAILNIKLELFVAENRFWMQDNSCDLEKIILLNNLLAILIEGKIPYKEDTPLTDAIYNELFSCRTPEMQEGIDKIYTEHNINRVKF